MFAYRLATTAPVAEDCVQVSDKDYMSDMAEDATRFVGLLRKAYPLLTFNKITCDHDFGQYIDIEMTYYDNTELLARWLMDHLPETWVELEQAAETPMLLQSTLTVYCLGYNKPTPYGSRFVIEHMELTHERAEGLRREKFNNKKFKTIIVTWERANQLYAELNTEN